MFQPTRTLLNLLLAAAPLSAADDFIKTTGNELGITIIGSIVQKASDDNVALIKDQSGNVTAVKKEHVIAEKFKVLAVHDGYIEVVARDARRYAVYSDKFADSLTPKAATGGPALTGLSDYFREDGFERNKGKIAMTGAYRDKLVKEDLAKVLMQATAEPYMEGGQIVGFKMSQIDEGSIYAKAGVADGDVITSINGQELNSVAGTISLLHSLKTAESVEVEVRRNGAPMTISAEVK